MQLLYYKKNEIHSLDVDQIQNEILANVSSLVFFAYFVFSLFIQREYSQNVSDPKLFQLAFALCKPIHISYENKGLISFLKIFLHAGNLLDIPKDLCDLAKKTCRAGKGSGALCTIKEKQEGNVRHT